MVRKEDEAILAATRAVMRERAPDMIGRLERRLARLHSAIEKIEAKLTEQKDREEQIMRSIRDMRRLLDEG